MKKNIRKIPSLVEAKIKAFGDKQFVVGCTKHYTQAELASGQLSRFGISIGEDGLASGGSEHLPSRKAGRYSKRNQTGYCIVRKDLPKVMREIPYDIKDWYGERHTGTYLRPCYARVYVEPGNVKIQAQVVHASEDGANIAFRLSDVLSVADHDWRRRLLAGLNVMQENIAACDVEGADTPLEEYEVSEHVQWKIFPDGIGIPCIADMVIRAKSGEEAEKKKGVVIDHLNFLKQLGVKFFVKGNDSFNGYVGAVFPDGVCVFDNVHYGNAAYVLKDDWKSLTKKSRSELRQHFREVVTPVAHHGDWKGYVCQLFLIFAVRHEKSLRSSAGRLAGGRSFLGMTGYLVRCKAGRGVFAAGGRWNVPRAESGMVTARIGGGGLVVPAESENLI